jgi:CheY-like chemotaxis protein
VLAGNLWRTKADASELENAVLNLAINARDAMPAGGKLVIETGNISSGAPAAGDFVRISVSDTGTGMNPDVLQHAFEPFFTTKEGRGTGLGLSTIYGFANQSGGHVTIESEQGSGTTVNLFLPREREAGAGRDIDAVVSVPLSQNAETVLVVEDDPKVRELSLQRVEGLGYVALEAHNAAAAIALLEKEHVDLLFSDIGLGRGPSGFELGRWVRGNRPGTKVLLTTGHASDVATEENTRDGFQILEKPYTHLQLAVALQEAIKAKS